MVLKIKVTPQADPAECAAKILQACTHAEICDAPAWQWEISPGAEPVACDIARRLVSVYDNLGNSVEDALTGVKNTHKNLSRYGQKITTVDVLKDLYNGMPAICVGAGPSAQNFIKQASVSVGDYRIFICDAMAKAFRKGNLFPSFVCSVERDPSVALVNEPAPYMRLICPPTICPEVPPKYHETIFWTPAFLHLPGFIRNPTPMPSCVSSGVMSIAAALHAGCNPIYLVGHDLCYDGDKSHAPSASAFAAESMSSIAGGIYPQEQKTQVGDHETHYLWQQMALEISSHIAKYPGVKVYRVGGGLPIPGTISIDSVPYADAGYVPKYETENALRCGVPAAEIVTMLYDIAKSSGIIADSIQHENLHPDNASVMLTIPELVPASGPMQDIARGIFQPIYNAMSLRIGMFPGKHKDIILRLARTIADHATACAKGYRK
jgi:hypothetical protein